eukprot:TRINITY_DN8474_c0_g2_i2.p1 TRINITY_DN8474_c0_g2~~TRINITY_DN8474_c0_g2_i2.p1  ORF type:complete len:585 (+),score=190.48 TRINITY_DN8474_c0_g2_i2:226-1980(+)
MAADADAAEPLSGAPKEEEQANAPKAEELESPPPSPKKKGSVWSRAASKVPFAHAFVKEADAEEDEQPVSKAPKAPQPPLSETEEGLTRYFEELNAEAGGTGKINRAAMVLALRDLGRDEADSLRKMGRTKREEFDLDAFLVLTKPPPVQSLMRSMGFEAMDEAALRDAFRVIDLDESGTIDKTELVEALRHLGRSEASIKQAVEPIPEDVELDFDSFRAVVQPKALDPAMLTDEALQRRFAALDTDDTGTLPRHLVAQALRDLGHKEPEVLKIMARTKKDDFDFDQFRVMAKPPKVASKVHNVPGLGAFTTAAAEAYYNWDENDLADAFARVDLDGSGTLHKAELAEALQQLGKSERKIKEYIDPFPDDIELDLLGFIALVKPKPFDPSGVTDQALKKRFDDMDSASGGTGQLARADVVKALRDIGINEYEIQKMLRRTKKEEFDFERFRAMAKPPQVASKFHNIPGFGAFTTAAAEAYYILSDSDLEDAFYRMDLDGSGSLDIYELREALRQLGKSERRIKELVDPLPRNTSLDLDSFRNLLRTGVYTPSSPTSPTSPVSSKQRFQAAVRVVIENGVEILEV